MKQRIFAKVSEVLVEALNVEQEEIYPEAELEKNLGAEQLDFLDIVFRLEREFGIKIRRNELFPEEKEPTCTVQEICDFIAVKLTAGAT